MLLSEHFHAAQMLSPKAARLAARLLDSAVDIPFEWRLTLRMALTERARGASTFTTTDLVPMPSTISAEQQPMPAHDQARLFMQAVQTDAAEHPHGAAGTSRAGKKHSS